MIPERDAKSSLTSTFASRPVCPVSGCERVGASSGEAAEVVADASVALD